MRDRFLMSHAIDDGVFAGRPELTGPERKTSSIKDYARNVDRPVSRASGGRLLAASVSTRRRQEADPRRDGSAGQGQLAATSGETRSRPSAAARGAGM